MKEGWIQVVELRRGLDAPVAVVEGILLVNYARVWASHTDTIVNYAEQPVADEMRQVFEATLDGRPLWFMDHRVERRPREGVAALSYSRQLLMEYDEGCNYIRDWGGEDPRADLQRQ